MTNNVLMVMFAFGSLVFLVVCFWIGWFIRSSGQEKKKAAQDLEIAKFKLKQEQQKLINELRQNKQKKQAEQLKELYYDLRKDLQEIENKIKKIRGKD